MSELLKQSVKPAPDARAAEPAAVPEINNLNEKPGISKTRLSIALTVAFLADVVLEFVPTPYGQVIDVITGLLLFGILGAEWLLLPAFIMEMIPLAGCFPTWMVAVGGISAMRLQK